MVFVTIMETYDNTIDQNLDRTYDYNKSAFYCLVYCLISFYYTPTVFTEVTVMEIYL